MDREKEEEKKIEFVDRRRIKSADDTLAEEGEPDLERLPTAVEKMKEEARQNDLRLKEYIAAYKERVAELDRARKRLEDESAARAQSRFAEVVAELFPALDDLDRAMASAREAGRDDQLAKGLEMTRNRIFSVLSRHGMEMIDCLNKEYDPEVAQAVAVDPVDDPALDNVVVQQLAPGYRMGAMVLRHAMVRVGQKKD
jgi:molecular chaperone GrpE